MLRSASILSAQSLPCLALIALGWGFNNLSLFFSNPARGVLICVTTVATVLAAVSKLDFNPLRKGEVASGSQSLQLGVLLILSLALLWFLPFADRRKILTLQHDYWRYVGLLLFTIGVVARIAALKALGENFSAYVTLQPNHRLVQDGIYASIRHPLYLSLLLIPTGIALVFASLLAVPILILAVLFVVDRIAKEDRLLASRFGSEFDDYQRRTRRLIPFVLERLHARKSRCPCPSDVRHGRTVGRRI